MKLIIKNIKMFTYKCLYIKNFMSCNFQKNDPKGGTPIKYKIRNKTLIYKIVLCLKKLILAIWLIFELLNSVYKYKIFDNTKK